MSFLVSFQGQFSPYIHSGVDAWHEKIHPISHLEPLNSQEVGHELPDLNATHHPPANQTSAYENQIKSFEKTKNRVYARDIMSSPVHFVHNSTIVSEAILLMKKFGFKHLLVFNGEEHLAGLLSDREFIGADTTATCEQLMIPKVLVALQSARIQEVAHIMLQEKINALPIVNEHHLVVGIITQSDILRYVIGNEGFLEFG